MWDISCGRLPYGGFDGTETAREQRDWDVNFTILSGDIDGNDQSSAIGIITHTNYIIGNNSYHVVTINSVNDVTLDGFVVTGGADDRDAGDCSTGQGGGIYIVNSVDVNIQHGTHQGNYAISGGGLYNANGSHTHLADMLFKNNESAYCSGGAITNRNSSYLSMKNVTMEGNTTEQTRGHGGGLVTYQNATTHLANVAFNGNHAGDFGGAIYIGLTSEVTVTNGLFSGNVADAGGAIANGSINNGNNRLHMTNITVSNNKARGSNFGGSFYTIESDLIIYNSIITANVTGASNILHEIYNDGSDITITYSIVPQAVSTHVSNIHADPQFVEIVAPPAASDPVIGGNYRLQPTSAAIDAGNNDVVPRDALDLDNDAETTELLPYDLDTKARVLSHTQPNTGMGIPPIVDMGAYETFDCNLVVEIPSSECEALVALYYQTNGPNWHNNTNWLAVDTPCSWYGVICGLGHVDVITLTANNLIDSLPSEIGNLTNLRQLWLINNEIGSLPPAIGNLANLQGIYLNNNQLMILPVEIGDLVNLASLELDNNHLTALPTSIGNLTNLQRLVLRDNEISNLPLEISNLTNLQGLYLKNNQLVDFPPVMGVV